MQGANSFGSASSRRGVISVASGNESVRTCTIRLVGVPRVTITHSDRFLVTLFERYSEVVSVPLRKRTAEGKRVAGSIVVGRAAVDKTAAGERGRCAAAGGGRDERRVCARQSGTCAPIFLLNL